MSETTKDRIKQLEQRITVLMLEGLESGPSIPVDKAFWDKHHNALKQRNGITNKSISE